jgi:hypothetical protein
VAEIVHRVYDVALEMDNDISIPYNPTRRINTTLTGKRVDIHYSLGGADGGTWYLRLGGSYPLDEPQKVCECCSEETKTRQGAVQRFGYPYGQAEADVPRWMYRLMVKYAPEWFPIPEF